MVQHRCFQLAWAEVEKNSVSTLAAESPGLVPAGALASVVPYGPALSEHCILLAELRPTRKVKAEPLTEAERASLLGGVRQWEAWLDNCETSAPEGFISLKRPGAQRPPCVRILSSRGVLQSCHETRSDI